jgi:hypothetical protein
LGPSRNGTALTDAEDFALLHRGFEGAGEAFPGTIWTYYWCARALRAHCRPPAREATAKPNRITIDAAEIMHEHESRSRRIYDCFSYNGELALLGDRLRALDKHVDRFVIVEGVGASDSPLIKFNAMDAGVARFAAKIRHVICDVTCISKSANREEALKQAAFHASPDLQGRDLLLLSDVATSVPRLLRAVQTGDGIVFLADREAAAPPPWSGHLEPSSFAESSRLPVVICPYLFDHERAEVSVKFALQSAECSHIRFFFWQDIERIGPEGAYEHCWNEFPDDDIIIIHSDMSPMPGQRPNQWYDDLCGFRKRMPWAGMLACNLIYPPRPGDDATYVQCAGGTFTNRTIGHLHGKVADDIDADANTVPRDLLRQVRLVDWVTFGGILIRRELLRACGPFDRRYEWAYVMDVDYSFEARSRGFVLAQVPVSLEHEESRTTRALTAKEPELLQYIESNGAKFYSKWGPSCAILPASQRVAAHSFCTQHLEDMNASASGSTPSQIDRRPARESADSATGLIILGMHRSGSSCLAGMLKLSGFYSGNVFRWNEDNRRGNQEDARIIELNNHVLEKSGGSWLEPPEGIAWTSTDETQRDKLLQEFSRSAPWTFKDPRSLFTVDFWKQANPPPRLLGIFRDPMSVAQSLATRNGLPLLRGLAVWEAYNIRLLREHERSPFPVVCFDLPRDEFLASVRAALLATCGNLVRTGRIDLDALAGFFDDALVHHVAKSNPIDALQELPGIGADFVTRLDGIYRALYRLSGCQTPLAARPSSSAALLQGLVEMEHATASGDVNAAYQLCSALLVDSPDRADLWMRLLALAKETGDAGKIESAIQNGLGKLPHDPYLLLQHAKRLWESGEFEQALQCAENGARAAESWLEPRLLLAAWQASRRQWPEVRDWLGPLVGANTANRWSRALLGIALVRLGEESEGDRLTTLATAEMRPNEIEAAHWLREWLLSQPGTGMGIEVRQRPETGLADILAALQQELQNMEPLAQSLTEHVSRMFAAGSPSAKA